MDEEIQSAEEYLPIFSDNRQPANDEYLPILDGNSSSSPEEYLAILDDGPVEEYVELVGDTEEPASTEEYLSVIGDGERPSDEYMEMVGNEADVSHDENEYSDPIEYNDHKKHVEYSQPDEEMYSQPFGNLIISINIGNTHEPKI